MSKKWLAWCGCHWPVCIWVSGVLEEAIAKKQPALAWLIVLPGAEQPTFTARRRSHSSRGGMSNQNMEITDTDSVKVSWRGLNMASSSESSRILGKLWGGRGWHDVRQFSKQCCFVPTAITRPTVTVDWVSLDVSEWMEERGSWLSLRFKKKKKTWITLYFGPQNHVV